MNLFFWKKKEVKQETIEEPFTLDLSEVSIEDFKKMMKYGKPSDTIGNYKSKPFIKLPYGVVKVEVPSLLNANKPEEVIKTVLSCQFDQVNLSNVTGNNCIQFILWIKEQLQFISIKEEQNLYSPPKPELLAAGIQRLDELGSYVTIDSLADRKLLDHDRISNLPYYQVYKKLKLDKIQREIEEAYIEIIKNKK